MAAGHCMNYTTGLAVAMEAYRNAGRNGTGDDRQRLKRVFAETLATSILLRYM